MAKPYDATTKHLTERHPRDWLALAGLPLPTPGGSLTIVDADLSAVTTASDKLIRVGASKPYLAHTEFQAGHDPDLDERVLVYHVLGRWRHRLPVRSVVFLLRPAAASGAAGEVQEILAPDARLDFGYRLVRVWELPVETVLSGGLGTLPLAPVSAVSDAEMPAVIERMRRRLDGELPPAESRELWAATRILMGLRYSVEVVGQLLKGVQGMEESVTYQEIILKGVERGRSEGKAEGERSLLVRLGTEKFGPPDAELVAKLAAIEDPQVLEDLGVRILHASDWQDWLR